MTKFSPAAAEGFASAYHAKAHSIAVEMIQGGGSTNDCPVCGHEHDMGEYPDHVLEMGPSCTFDFKCEECGAQWETKVEFEPIFWTRCGTIRSKTRAEA
jgi:hypothetical protein